MQIIERIRKVMKDQSLTQVELARLMGVHPSSIANYLYEQRKPDAVACLCLAGVTKNLEDRRAFLRDSKLKPEQLALIAVATSGPPDGTQSTSNVRVIGVK